MAQASPAPAAADSGPNLTAQSSGLPDLGTAYQTLEKADSADEARLTDIDKADLSSERDYVERANDLKQPDLQPVPSPQVKSTSPMQEWGSAAMVLAALGSLFTRNSLTTAMNASAAAIKGFRQGDQEAFDTAYKSWQVASDNAMKLYEFQTKTYENILGKLDRERNLSREEANDLRREVYADMQANARAFGDDASAHNTLEGQQRLVEESKRAQGDFARSQIEIGEWKAKTEAAAAWLQTPEAQKQPNESDGQWKYRIAQHQMSIWAPAGRVGGANGFTLGDGSPKDKATALQWYKAYANPALWPKDPRTGQAVGPVSEGEYMSRYWPGVATGQIDPPLPPGMGGTGAPAPPAAPVRGGGQGGALPHSIPLGGNASKIANGASATMVMPQDGKRHRVTRQGNQLIVGPVQ